MYLEDGAERFADGLDAGGGEEAGIKVWAQKDGCRKSISGKHQVPRPWSANVHGISKNR